MRQSNRPAFTIFITLGTISSAHAALPIFGGPTYSSTTNTGATPITLATPGHSAAEGVAVGSAVTSNPAAVTGYTTSLGYRWSTSGPVENLGNVPVGSSAGGINFYSGARIVNAVAANHAAVGYEGQDGSDFTFPIGSSGPGAYADYWDASNNVHHLNVLPPVFGSSAPEAAYAFNLNRANVIVGASEDNFDFFGTINGFGQRAVRWDSYSATPVDLGTPSTNLSNAGSSQALFINDAGNIAGTYEQLSTTTNVDYGPRPVRWAPGSTTPVVLGTFPAGSDGKSNTVVAGQNASGTIVGASERAASVVSGASRVLSAVRWDVAGTTLTSLGDLSGDGSLHTDSQAYAINDSGVVIGYSHVGVLAGMGTGDRPVRWNANSTVPIELPTLGISSHGASNGRAYAINNLGTAAGYSERYNFQGVLQGKDAVLWLNDAQTTIDLNSYLPANSGWVLQSANDITTAGYVSGTGTYDPPGADAAYQRGFLMLIPQAGTYGLGDANFDGKVNFDDLVILAQHYNASNAAQNVNVADFNLDGQTNFDDLIVLAQHYNTTPTAALSLGSAAFAADWALAQSLVPEPTMLCLVTPLLLLRRRRSPPACPAVCGNDNAE